MGRGEFEPQTDSGKPWEKMYLISRPGTRNKFLLYTVCSLLDQILSEWVVEVLIGSKMHLT